MSLNYELTHTFSCFSEHVENVITILNPHNTLFHTVENNICCKMLQLLQDK